MTITGALISFVIGQILIVLIYFATFNKANLQTFSDAEISEKRKKVIRLLTSISIKYAIALVIAVLVTQ